MIKSKSRTHLFNHVDHGITLPELHCETTEVMRTYETPEGNKYPSVTTVLGSQNKEGLERWKERVGAEEAAKISHQAGVRGDAVHQICEDYLNNLDHTKGQMPTNLFSFNQIKPILDKNVNNIWFQECPLYSDRLRTAGRVDMIAEWKKELSIIDFKTSLRPKKEEWITSYFMQMAFYAAAFYERTGKPVKKGVIVMIVDHSTPQVFEVNTFDYLKPFIDLRNQYKVI